MNLTDLMEGAQTLTDEIDFYEKPKQIQDENVYGRCLYLLYELKITLPQWLQVKIPYAEELQKSQAMWAPLIADNFRKGKSYGKGSIEELKEILDALVYAELKDFSERQRFSNYINSLSGGLFSTNVEKPLSEVEGSEIEKWNSGFQPVDKVINGFYQGVFCIAGLPGSGKTSVCLSIASELAKQFPVWYFQTEIPSSIIESRIQQLEPELWHKDSYFFAGNYNTQTILEKVNKNPNPNRIIIYDSPEIVDSVSSTDLLNYFFRVYQDLVQLKLHSKMVIVTSQIKQGLKWEDLTHPYCLNDSASKARYLDGIIYLGNIAGNLMVRCGKNRFGPTDKTSISKYNYITMRTEEDFVSDLFD